MINKLNSYLLTHYPRIWNMRLVPIALLLVTAHILFAIIGYALTDSSINYNDNAFDGFYYIVFAGSILTSILIFIFWLIQYSKNNGLKAYYPYTNRELYLEWIGIVCVCCLIVFLPLTLTKGKDMKWMNAMSAEDVRIGRSTITRANILLPKNLYDYKLDSYENESPSSALTVGDAVVDRTKFDTKLFTYEEDAETPDKPVKYVGPSLLYYSSYWAEEDELESVKDWLKDENKVEIEKLMQDYIALQEKHNLKTNLEVDKWMKMIYNPPLYPITEDTKIHSSPDDVYNHVEDSYAEADKVSQYYRSLYKYHDKDKYDYSSRINLVLLSMAIGLSVLVFSGRFTSSKSWIFALLSLGVIYFVFFIVIGLSSLLFFSMESFMLMPILSLTLFGLIIYGITIKVVNGERKGRSNIYMHIGLWFVPSFILLIMQLYFYLRSMVSDDYTSLDDIFWNFSIFNVIFTILMMYPAVMLLRKWKALPED